MITVLSTSAVAIKAQKENLQYLYSVTKMVLDKHRSATLVVLVRRRRIVQERRLAMAEARALLVRCMGRPIT